MFRDDLFIEELEKLIVKTSDHYPVTGRKHRQLVNNMN